MATLPGHDADEVDCICRPMLSTRIPMDRPYDVEAEASEKNLWKIFEAAAFCRYQGAVRSTAPMKARISGHGTMVPGTTSGALSRMIPAAGRKYKAKIPLKSKNVRKICEYLEFYMWLEWTAAGEARKSSLRAR